MRWPDRVSTSLVRLVCNWVQWASYLWGSHVFVGSHLQHTAGFGPWIYPIPFVHRQTATADSSQSRDPYHLCWCPDIWLVDVSDVSQLSAQMSDCMEDVASWMTSSCLQLNLLKTKVLWCSSTQHWHYHSQQFSATYCDLTALTAANNKFYVSYTVKPMFLPVEILFHARGFAH